MVKTFQVMAFSLLSDYSGQWVGLKSRNLYPPEDNVYFAPLSNDEFYTERKVALGKSSFCVQSVRGL